MRELSIRPVENGHLVEARFDSGDGPYMAPKQFAAKSFNHALTIARGLNSGKIKVGSGPKMPMGPKSPSAVKAPQAPKAITAKMATKAPQTKKV